MATLKNTEIHASREQRREQANEELYIQIGSVVDTVREPVLVLDADLHVHMVNEAFCRIFQVDEKTAKGMLVYALGNGQWDIPALHTLLEEIVPQNIFFKGYEITHEFPFLGQKHLIVNARLIRGESDVNDSSSAFICVAFEDMSAILSVAETIAFQVQELASRGAAEMRRLEMHVERLEKEIRPQGRKR